MGMPGGEKIAVGIEGFRLGDQLAQAQLFLLPGLRVRTIPVTLDLRETEFGHDPDVPRIPLQRLAQQGLSRRNVLGLELHEKVMGSQEQRIGLRVRFRHPSAPRPSSVTLSCSTTAAAISSCTAKMSSSSRS